MNKRACQNCGAPLWGRTDKKFCSDHCRNHFNNRLNSEQNNFMRRVNLILRRNRKILYEISQENNKKVNRAMLYEQGFNFHFFTHQKRIENGQVCYFIYEKGYIPIDEKHVNLVSINEFSFN